MQRRLFFVRPFAVPTRRSLAVGPAAEAASSAVASAIEVGTFAISRLVDLDRGDDLRKAASPAAPPRPAHVRAVIIAARSVQYGLLGLVASAAAFVVFVVALGLQTERRIETKAEERRRTIASGVAVGALCGAALTRLRVVPIAGTLLLASFMSYVHAVQVIELIGNHMPEGVPRSARELAKRVWRSPARMLDNNAACINGLIVVGYPVEKNVIERLLSRWGVRPDWDAATLAALVAHERGHADSLAFFTIFNAVLLRGALRTTAIVEDGIRWALQARAGSVWRATGARVVGVGVAGCALLYASNGAAWLNELCADAHAGHAGSVLLPVISKNVHGSFGLAAHPPVAMRQRAWSHEAHGVVTGPFAQTLFRASAAAIDWIPARGSKVKHT